MRQMDLDLACGIMLDSLYLPLDPSTSVVFPNEQGLAPLCEVHELDQIAYQQYMSSMCWQMWSFPPQGVEVSCSSVMSCTSVFPK